MAEAIAAFELAYKNWLHHNGFLEHLPSMEQTAIYRIIFDSQNNTHGVIIRTQGRIRLELDVCEHGIEPLKIDKLTYLSIQEDHQIVISVKNGYICWLNHTCNIKDICTTCLAAKHNLRCVREAGRTWLLINFLADVKHLIAQQLSQLALPDDPSS